MFIYIYIVNEIIRTPFYQIYKTWIKDKLNAITIIHMIIIKAIDG